MANPLNFYYLNSKDKIIHVSATPVEFCCNQKGNGWIMEVIDNKDHQHKLFFTDRIVDKNGNKVFF